MDRLHLYHVGVLVVGIIALASSAWFILNGSSAAASNTTFPLIGAVVGVIVGTLLTAKGTFELKGGKKTRS